MFLKINQVLQTTGTGTQRLPCPCSGTSPRCTSAAPALQKPLRILEVFSSQNDSVIQGGADCRAALRAPQHGLDTLTKVRAMPGPNLDPHFSQRRNAQPLEVGKSPVSCCDGNVLIMLQLARAEHGQRNHSGQRKCNPVRIH